MSDKRLSRRTLLGMAATSAALIPMESSGVLRMSGSRRQVLVPADKGFSKSWLTGLSRRGAPRGYKGKALDHVAVPIGGIGCGQVYLSGDGRLTYWDIFNEPGGISGTVQNGLHYSEPIKPASPFEIGFYLCEFRGDGRAYRSLDAAGFPHVEFVGKYPISNIQYGSTDSGLAVGLEAFSPFIPLNPSDSGLPVAVFTYTLSNRSQQAIDCELVGHSEAPGCLYSRKTRPIRMDFSPIDGPEIVGFASRPVDDLPAEPTQPDIVFEDFEKETYEGWTVEGDAFGPGPIEIAKIPGYQGDVKGRGKRVVNSHNARNGESIEQADAHTGKLTSKPFTIDRRFITMLLGGGNHPGQTCVNLVVEGKIVRTATGRDSNQMAPMAWDVRDLVGKSAHIEIVDDFKGPWGNIGVDDIAFTDRPNHARLSEESDFGEFAIAALSKKGLRHQELTSWTDAAPGHKHDGSEVRAVGYRLTIPAQSETTVSFLVAWHFPNVNRASLGFLEGIDKLKRHYAKDFPSVSSLCHYVSDNFSRLSGLTRLWTQTWYDSTLPFWFLDRTMANTSTLSTATSYWFDSGRFYGWEGVYCCAGTCTHVWQYAHAVARLFPSIERDIRERVDYGIAFHPNGSLGHRAEAWQDAATDGQCGTILRVYREHQMSSDTQFLARIWPRVKTSIQFMIGQDPTQDGVLEGPQFNTLDATWYGKIAWISGLYCAALRAGEAMAMEMGDSEFASLCGRIAEHGKQQMTRELFNGEYFIQKVDPKFRQAINTNDGCHIDQVFGQSWAMQVGLPRIFPEPETKKALISLFRYNFAPDVGKYRSSMKDIRGGRWYALAGEPGLLMCTWPRGGAKSAPGEGQADFAIGYFNECMSGFEHQVAAHMICEGLVTEGLAVERTIHDRYDGDKRNPYNEIECSDHYARAMASYGVFIAACGFDCHGPKGHLTFRPKLSPDRFKAAFTSAEGWGSYSQNRQGGKLACELSVKFGKVSLRTLTLEGNLSPTRAPHGHTIRVVSQSTVEFDPPVEIRAGEHLKLEFNTAT